MTAYTRRSYHVRGDDLDKAKAIRIVVISDGERIIDIAAPEPGMLAFVSREDDQGFSIEVVEPGMQINDLDGGAASVPYAWQQMALGI